MVMEKEIIDSFKKNIKNLFESTDFVKVNSIKSGVNSLLSN